ncbi:hypothetical protein GT347_17415 [Xylophilus rhododendri]|uniref:Uncharacterized protein n=2 Tax=Xylophilus rhododendri TaxID=2697032 RepID=A0A857JA24_9BURK|nr:hypothetical protein GT347_17415 [Xylophilus rhododendri]
MLGRPGRSLALPAATLASLPAAPGEPTSSASLNSLPRRADAATQTDPVPRSSTGSQTEECQAVPTPAEAQAHFLAQVESASEKFGTRVCLTVVRDADGLLGCLLSSPAHRTQMRQQKRKPVLLIAGGERSSPDRPKFESPLPCLLVPAAVCAEAEYDAIDLARHIRREEFDFTLCTRHPLLADLPNRLIGTRGPSVAYAARFVHHAGTSLHHRRAVEVFVAAPGEVALYAVLRMLSSPKTGRLDGRYGSLAYVVVETADEASRFRSRGF